MEQIYLELTRLMEPNCELEINLLPEGQVIISKNIAPNPVSADNKTPTVAPTDDGYMIHIRHASTDSKLRPQQRRDHPATPIGSNEGGVTLQLDRHSISQNWELDLGGGHVSIVVRCGSERVFDEVDIILAVVSRLLVSLKDDSRWPVSNQNKT
jgi:hypothetical protein